MQHSAGKCDVIGPKNHVPMGTKVGKVTNKPCQRHLRSMWTFRQKQFLAPGVPRTYDPGSIFFFFLLKSSKVPVSFLHPQNNFLGSNVDLFSNQEADFEVEIISPNGYVGSVLNIFLPKITHTID